MTDTSRSRAMAVTAHEGRAYIYVLKSMDEMRVDFKDNSRLEPIKEVGVRTSYSVQTSRLMIMLL